MEISPAQRARIRRLAAPGDHDPSEAGGELNVVPFLDIVMNVLLFVLATMPAVFTATIDVDPVRHSITRGKPTLQLTMMVTDEGVALKTDQGAIGAGCEPGAGLTVPSRDGALDRAALTSCARRLKSHPDFSGESSITVTASNGVAYSSLVQAMDAVREDTLGPLFPDVKFAVVR